MSAQVLGVSIFSSLPIRVIKVQMDLKLDKVPKKW